MLFSGCAQIIEPRLRVRWIGSHLWCWRFFELRDSDKRVKINSARLRCHRRNGRMDHIFRRWSIDTVSINLKKDFSARIFHLKIAEITAQRIWDKPHFSRLIAFRDARSSFTPPCNSTCYGIYCQLHLLCCRFGSHWQLLNPAFPRWLPATYPNRSKAHSRRFYTISMPKCKKNRMWNEYNKRVD